MQYTISQKGLSLIFFVFKPNCNPPLIIKFKCNKHLTISTSPNLYRFLRPVNLRKPTPTTPVQMIRRIPKLLLPRIRRCQSKNSPKLGKLSLVSESGSSLPSWPLVSLWVWFTGWDLHIRSRRLLISATPMTRAWPSTRSNLLTALIKTPAIKCIWQDLSWNPLGDCLHLRRTPRPESMLYSKKPASLWPNTPTVVSRSISIPVPYSSIWFKTMKLFGRLWTNTRERARRYPKRYCLTWKQSFMKFWDRSLNRKDRRYHHCYQVGGHL